MENNNISYSQQQEDGGLSLRDIWGLCIGHWQWFLLSLAVCMLLATYYVVKSVPVYVRNASVLIKEDRKGASLSSDISSQFADLGFGVQQVNVNNEIINFLSPDLMLQVVKNLNLDVDYKLPGLRYKHTIYGSSLPVQVQYLDVAASNNTEMELSMLDSAAVLSDFVRLGGRRREGVKCDPIVVTYGDTTATPFGNVIVTLSPYATAALDKPIIITRSTYGSAARGCGSRLTATLSAKNTTVIDLSFKDVNTQRAEDVLRMVINVYNENWIKDKNQITTSTNEFIAERLRIIEHELGNVDKTITDYRSTHRLPDAGSVIQMDMQLSAEAGKHLMELNNQLSIARFLQSDIRGSSTGALLPANVGLDDSSTSNQISQYNTTMLQRNQIGRAHV